MLFLLRQARCRAATPRRLSNSPARYLQTARVIFSGIQPTGVPHLGNYLGALRQWVTLQDAAAPDETLLYAIVDLHAITLKQDPAQLRQWRREMLASLLAVGLDPKRSIIFCQSDVPQHAELMWILSCNASMGYLSRMTQWKSKLSLPATASPLDLAPPRSPSAPSLPSLKLGLFSYPVLQAADILLYRTTHVPVGEDQSQHLEFAREVANSFNHIFSPTTPLLIPPETILSPAKRIMSLTKPTKKMSKSDPDIKSRILITDSKDVISKKLKSSLTDSLDGISYNHSTRPGVSNLIDIMYYLDESIASSPVQLCADFQNMSLKALKEKVAEAVDTQIRDVRERYESVMGGDAGALADVGDEGARKAEERAKETIGRVRKVLGFTWD
ncbi:tryptophanyl-tRNA synthetase [Lindgomyces ingoldianus]|uniref:Tryptophanyl-tRNA synthetase n=1 Tax=Lindgomyces ingoldianus TaxID=673940 RepID=A0ACB6R4Y4_9PLEO|nr:tryptophanyl-tRNA synthetase [Lindgomyces ingoldianus]KAF2474309.1 tryptophanyl-tRNA synthetase [Lindgomyces ingoldianus]